MAKRTRINKRLVIILSTAVGVLLLGVGFGLWRFRHRIFPKDPVAYAESGMAAFESGDYQTAIEDLGTAIKASKGKNATYYYDLGRVHLAWVRKDGLLKEPKLTESRRRELFFNGLSVLKRAREVDPNYVDPQRMLYEEYWIWRPAGWEARFITEADGLIRLVPDDHLAYFRLGLVRERLARNTRDAKTIQQAIADYQKAIDLKTDEMNYWLAWLRILAWTEPFTERDRAQKGFARALEANPDIALLRITYAGYLHGKGIQLLQSKALRDEELEKFKKQLTKAIEKQGSPLSDTELEKLKKQLAEAIEKKGRALTDQELEKLCDNALLETVYAACLQRKGLQLLRDKLLSDEELNKQLPGEIKKLAGISGEEVSREAVKRPVKRQLTEAIEREPTSPLGHVAMARYLMREKEYDKALAQLQSAEKVDPTYMDIYILQSDVYRALKALDKAAEALARALAEVEKRQAQATDTHPVRKKLRLATWQLNFLLANIRLDQLAMTREADKRAALLKDARKAAKAADKLPDMPEQPRLRANLRALRAKTEGRIALVEAGLEEDPRKREVLLNKATRLLENAFKVFGPRDLQTANFLIAVYQRRRMPGKAERVFNTLRNAPRHANNPSILLGLARLKVKYRDLEGAEDLNNRVLRADPDNQVAKQLQADLRVLMGDAEPTAGQTLSAPAVRILLERADVLWSDQKRDEAMEKVQGLYQAMPRNLTVIKLLINMHLQLGHKDRAEEILDKAMKEFPDNEDLKFHRKLLDAPPDERLAMQLARADKIKDPFRKAWTKAIICARSGLRQQYVQLLQQAAKLKPDAPVIIEMQFRHALAQRDWKLADEVIARAAKGDEIMGQFLRARALLARNKPQEAVDVLVPARKQRPGSRTILRLLGDAYLALGDIDKAAEVYGVLESNDHGDVQAIAGLAKVAQQRKEWDTHERWVRQAYRIPQGKRHPYIAASYLAIQEKYATGKKLQEVIEKRERILRQRPGDLNNVERLARLYELRTRELDKAERVYLYGLRRSGRALPWVRAVVFFYARTAQPAKGDALLQETVRDARDKAQKVAALVLHGDWLSLYDAQQACNAYLQATSADPSNPIPHLALARLHARRGNWPMAVESMIKYLAIATEDTRGRKALIEYRINARQYDEAERDLKTLLDRAPYDAQTLMLKAVLYMARDETRKALAPLNLALKKNPDFPAALVMRSRAYVNLGEPELAKADLERARGQSDEPNIVMQLAEVYVRLDDLAGAEIALQGLLGREQTYEPALRRLLGLFMMQSKWRQVENELARGKKLFPKQPYYWLVEADMWRRRGQQDKAIAALAQARKLAPDSPAVVRRYLVALLDAKQHDTVLTVSKAYEGRAGWDAWLNAVRARAMVGKNQAPKADKLFLQSITGARTGELDFIVNQIRAAYGGESAIAKLTDWARRRPDEWLVVALLGDLHAGAGADPDANLTPAQKQAHRSKAITTYQAARRMAKKPPEIAVMDRRLGRAYYADRKYPQAEQAYLAALKVLPNDISSLNNLAYMYANELNQPAKALPHAEKALKFMPRDANILDTYGWVLAKLKKYPEAEKKLEQSIRYKADLPANRYHLGWVYEQTGRIQAAKNQYRLGMELVRQRKNDPLRKTLQEALRRVGAS